MPAFTHHVALIFGASGQTLEFYPPAAEALREGAPTAAATYQVYGGTQSNDETAKFSGTATLDSVSTTVSTVSGYTQSNRNRLYLTSTASVVVGRRYLLKNAQGQREVVIPTLVETTYVDLEEALANDYAITTSTLVGLRQVFTVDAAFIAAQENINLYSFSPLLDQASEHTQAPPFRVEWRYTTGSTAQRSWTSFDVCRTPAKTLVHLDELLELFPDLIQFESINTRGQGLQPQLRAAERDLRIAVRAAGYDPDQIQDPEYYQRLLLQKWAVVIGNGLLFARPDVGQWLDTVTKDFTVMFQQAIGTALRVWMSTGSTGAVTPDPPRQLWLGSR